MKILTALALAGFLLIAGCADSETTPSTSIADASHRVEASVSGMDCGGCTSHVCGAVEQIAGVTGATADLEAGKVFIALEKDADTNAAKAEIEKVITGLSDGKFTVGGIETFTPDKKTPNEAEAADQGQESHEDA